MTMNTLVILVFLAGFIAGVDGRSSGIRNRQLENDPVRVRRTASRFISAIEKLDGHEHYGAIRTGADRAVQEATDPEKDNLSYLTDDQRTAVYFYTMENPQFYLYLNNHLRNDGRGEYSDYVDLLLSALRKIGVSYPGTVWRGLDSNSIWHTKGDVVQWRAFSSTTPDENNGILDNHNIIYKITHARGYYIKAYSKFPRENEYLLPPNATLQVTVEPETVGGKTRYTLKLINLGNTASVLTSTSRWFWVMVITMAYITAA